jgi:tetratricopeptide (TPR) repeat protein
MSVIERVAEVLEIPPVELAGGSAVIASPAPEDQRAASDLALALVSSISLRAAVESPKVDGDILTTEALQAWEYAHSSSYTRLGELLLSLLPQMETAARASSGKESRQAYSALAKAYHAAAAVLSKMGQTAAAWVAVERAIAAAEKSGDPLLMAEGAFRLTLVFQGARWLDLAQRTASSAIDALDMLDSRTFEISSLMGALHLQLAVVAAKSDSAEVAYRQLDEARALADELDGDRNDYDTEFGPTNVQLHEVAVAVELGDAGRALRVASSIDDAALSAERRARLRVDVARAHTQRRNVGEAVKVLEEADVIAPEQVRSHPLVRSMVADLLQMTSTPSDELDDLVTKIGLDH